MKGALCIALVILSSAACTKIGSNAPIHQQTLILGLRAEPNSLNPILLQGTMATRIGELMYSYLLTVDAGGALVPDAATSVPTLSNGGISADGLLVTYHLRKGIRWQDGAALTSRDCVFTYNAIMNPRNNVPSREGYDQIASVTAPDDYTIAVHMKRRYSPIVGIFLSLSANYPILPAHLWSRYSDLNHAPFQTRGVGSGPYRLAEWQHGDRLTFEANAGYFRGRPGLQRITFSIVPSNSTMLNELRTHELDASVDVDDPTAVHQMGSIPGYHVVQSQTSGVMNLAFNTAQGPLRDRGLRRALTYAIDVDRIVAKTTQGVDTSHDAMRGMFGWTYRSTQGPSYDPRRAEQLLDSGGWRRGANGVRTKNGEPLSLVLVLSNSAQVNQTIAAEVQQELRQVGVELSIKGYGPTQFVASANDGGPLFGGRFSLALLPIVFSPVGPDSGSYFACAQRMPAGFNFTRLCDPAFDRLYEDGIRTYDRERILRDAAAMERRLVDDAPWIPLYQLRNVAVLPSYFYGYAPNTETPYANVWQWTTH